VLLFLQKSVGKIWFMPMRASFSCLYTPYMPGAPIFLAKNQTAHCTKLACISFVLFLKFSHMFLLPVGHADGQEED
jgi:hypothetical protein